MIEIYLAIMIPLHALDEVYSCNMPNTIDNDSQIFCRWNDKDFVELKNGDRILRPKRKKDNIIKAYYRKKWWRENVTRRTKNINT